VKKIFISFLFVCIPYFVLAADLPAWIKNGKSSRYPSEQFLTAVGKGETEKEAAADSQKNIIQNVTDMLVSKGIEKTKISVSPATIIRSFETGYSYNDKENKVYYVFGTVDKNMARINIEDDLYASEQALQYRTAIYETSNLSAVPKIRAINELLELYSRRDSIITLKKALTDNIVNIEVGEFEREKLAMDKKKLLNNIVYYINAENFDTSKIIKFARENNVDIIGSLPSAAPSADKGVVIVSCKIQADRMPDKDKISYDWVADLVLSDAFNEKTVLHSDTSAGDESGADETQARSKAFASAEKEMNLMAEKFFKPAD
jgi:hypothetical protein